MTETSTGDHGLSSRPSPVLLWAASSGTVDASRACVVGGSAEWSSGSGPGLSESSCGGGGGACAVDGSSEGGAKGSDANPVGDDSGSQGSLSAGSHGGGFEGHGRAGGAEPDGADAGWQLSLTVSSCGAGSDGAGRASETESAIAAPGWRRRVHCGKIPEGRDPDAGRVSALKSAMRGFANRTIDFVIDPSLGTEFDSLSEAYDFYNLYSWEIGFGIRYGHSRKNVAGSKTVQEIICGCGGKPQRSNNTSVCCECPARIVLRRTDDHGKQIAGFHSRMRWLACENSCGVAVLGVVLVLSTDLSKCCPL
ncbi:hypothetical protein ACQ4PT_055629 [Festuca glaucescens]